jgi:hypothetical protein
LLPVGNIGWWVRPAPSIQSRLQAGGIRARKPTMASLAGTTSLNALAVGFGLETDSQPQRQGIEPDGDHQVRWKPDDS